jgi:L-lactate dehydrogenase complex protein LldG
MDDTTSREKILKKVRAALINKSKLEPGAIDFESNIYTESEEPLELIFAQQFSDAGGNFVFCENDDDFIYNITALTSDENLGKLWSAEPGIQNLLQQANIPFLSSAKELEQAGTTITGCEFLIARTGSILISSKQLSGRRASVYPVQHIVVAKTSQLILHMKDALKAVKAKYNESMPSMVSVITGPSRTADIEKTLVQGAHGPKEIYVFMIDDVPMQIPS